MPPNPKTNPTPNPKPEHKSPNLRRFLLRLREKSRTRLSTKGEKVSTFEWFTVVVILISSLDIGLKTYPLPAHVLPALDVVNAAVTVYFLLEIIIRLLAETRMRDFFRSGWNVFDALIVTISLIPVDDSEYVLLGRLLRLFRVMRLFVFLPQLRELVEALLKTIPKVGYVVLMMFVLFYMYGAFGSLLFAEINPQLWGNVGIAMLTLFRVATLEDWTDIMYETMAHYPLSWIFYVSFIVLTTFVMLNMVVGIIVDTMRSNVRIEDPPKQDAQLK